MSSLQLILLGAFIVYTVAVALFIILDNRSPQSTFAWLLLFIFFPVIGLLIYLFTGRSWRAFSRENKLARQTVGSDLGIALESLLRRQKEITRRIATERPAVFNHRLLQLHINTVGSLLTEYNEVDILQDAAEKYPHLLADLRAAKDSIHLEYYIWTNDAFTQELKSVLIERAQAGVKVRALYDATSGKAMGQRYRRELRAAGVAIHPYLDYNSLRTLHNVQYRSHRKIVIIDGEIGYVGGMNLDKEQLDGPKGFAAWRDTHLRIHGEAALALQSSFIVSWFNTTGERIVGPDYFPLDRIRENVQQFLPVQITQSGPDSQWSAIRQLYFFMIMAADKRIYIQSPFFIPEESISEALKAAALAGVEVHMMFQPRGGTFQIPYRAANTYFAEMAQAGAHIYLYQNNTYFHSKTLNIDGAICSIGSANMDIRSFSINYEINAVVYDEGIAAELEQDFFNDLAHCIKFDLAEYKARPLMTRMVDSLYRLASPLL